MIIWFTEEFIWVRFPNFRYATINLIKLIEKTLISAKQNLKHVESVCQVLSL